MFSRIYIEVGRLIVNQNENNVFGKERVESIYFAYKFTF